MVNRRSTPPAAAPNEEAVGGDGLAIARYLGATLREKLKKLKYNARFREKTVSFSNFQYLKPLFNYY